MGDAPGALELTADRPRPAVESFRGAARALRLTAAATAEVRQAAEREGVSLDVFLLAGLAALLARYSAAEDLVIGVSNGLPVRLQWTGDPPFLQLVALVDGSLRSALAKEELPFQVIFSGPDAGTAEGSAGLPSDERKLAVDLAFSVCEAESEVTGGGEARLLLTLDYAIDLFDATTAARLLGHYAALLAGAAAAPELPLSRLPLLGEAERHQMLAEWNDTASAFPRRALHKLFEEQVAARPDAPAVVWDGGTLTYRELDRQASRIARRLRRLGVGPESRVALYLERSPDMVAAVLGVLKAGGAYLPIELSYPRERLDLLLEDAAPAAIVGTSRSLAGLPGQAPHLAVDLLAVHPATARQLARRLDAGFAPDEPAKALADRLAGVYRMAGGAGGETLALMRTMAGAAAVAVEAEEEEDELSADVPPESLAYVLYTSGSTGTPNGVEVTHEAVVRLVRETGYLSFGPGDVFLQMALMSFDASTLELWWPLANGGCVALPPPGPFALGDLYEQVRRHRVTALFLTTGLFHVAVEEGLAGLAGLRHLLVGGDVMSRSHLEQAVAELPGVELIHCYGPTENTVFTSTWPVRLPLAEGSVTIGRPIATVRAYVLDPALAPVPVGAAGELYLSGPGLARGYLHRPALTAERFLPNPFEPDPFEAARLYKTGDLVRWRPDGTLAFLGRHDFQVKVRGFRIEPGEIEAALLLHPGVREAAVVGLAEGGRDHRVVAYYVTEPGSDASPEDLRAFLRARLPGHMVPAAFVPLAALPLTNVGKLDRRALLAPEAHEPAPGGPGAGPRAGVRDPSDLSDLVMEMLAGLWEEVLDPEPQRGPAADRALDFERSRRIGADDDFFDLGGHSLTVMRLLSRIRQTFGVELGAQTLFAFPTLAAQARVVAAARRGAESALPPLEKVPRQGPPALSFAQQRLWFLDRLAPESPLYNVPTTWLITGELSPAALAAALSEIVRRHETLRTRFVEVDGEPRQEIFAPWQVPLPLVDLGALDPERRLGELARLRGEEAGRPFHLARGPLLRAGLVRLYEEKHALLLTVHHIVYDGWSEEVLVAELTALYAAALAGRPSPLAELPVQYADFAAWQRGWPAEVLGRQLAYWRDALAGAPAALALPADRQRPAEPSVRGASAMLRLPAAEAVALRQAARREGTTLYMLLLAGFAAFLARVTGEEDLLVGTPVADRPRPEVEGLIGFFVNTVVIRARAAGDPSFRGLLAAVRETALAAFAHQDLPFDMLVEELRPERERSRNPLVQALFTFQGSGQATAAMAGPEGDAAALRLVRLPWGERTTAKLDLILSAMEMPAEEGETDEAELALVLEYAADLFTAPTAARLLGHYGTLVAGAAASPELPLSGLPLLSAPERHQLVAEWNDTESGFPERTVHGLFAEQAAARPDAVAVSWEEGEMSYGELDRRSGEIARHLRRRGVATDARVALVVERSPEMVAALLGILKAGGGYMPLDPSYPRERLALLLADAAPAAVVGPRHLLAALPEIPNGAPCLAFEDAVPAADAADTLGALGEVSVPPASLAYVLYTSGSTGTPKGVEVSHRAVVRLVREAGYASFGPGEVYLQLVPMSFDVATFEIWGPLLNGGRLALLPPGPYTLADVHAAVARHGVTTLWLTSGLFHLAVEEGLAPLGGLRQLLSGGDVLSRPHVERALAALPGVDLINGYGPTENTTFSTTHRLRDGLPAGETSVPIGRPIPGSRAYVLDRSLAPLPVACVGELYVGGAGVARGYLGRPALTAERFVPDPLAADPRGENRLYSTGDLARWRPDGTLDFLGRRDFQVKVRGFRVELGEVESALLLHPGVREAVVTAAPAGGEEAGGHRLVAYYVPEGADGPAVAELRAHLQGSLPEHMVPSLFVPLAGLPLNANGKVDRRALPAPGAPGARLAGETGTAGETRTAPHTPSRNPVEEVIAGIWEDLLGLDPGSRALGVEDDFFHIGGHSLLAIRMLSRLRAVLGADLPVQQAFDSPTIAGLAAAVARAAVSGASAAGPALPPLAPRASAAAAAPPSYAQQRLWFLDRLAPGSPAYNVPSAYGIAGPLAPAALAAALAEVARRHEILRARFVERDGEPELEIAAAPGFLALPLLDLSALPPALRSAELAELRAAEAERPFDLAVGPLLRAALVRLGAEEHGLLLNFHHAVYDAWSEGVLLRELAALYDAARAGAPSPLAEPALQYADYAAWQRSWPEEVLGRQLAYWREELAGAPTALEVPADRPRPAVASLRGASRRRLLGAPEMALLRQSARREGVTLYMLLLAAFAATLARHGGQEDVLVATPVTNRTRPELEGLIGFFVNTLALRVRLAGDPEFHRVLASARQAALAGFAHQDLPFEALIEELRPERDLSRAPLAQAMLSLGAARPERQLGGGLRLVRLPSTEKTTAKLDLALAATEVDAPDASGTADGGQSLLLELEYAADLFHPTGAERLLAHFATLLCGAAAAPELPLSHLPLLAPAERHQLVAEWNDTESGFPERTVHGLFAEQAAARPDAVAVSWEGGEMSYGELDRRSSEIARHLRRRGVALDARVALVVERSPEMVAALLGILKAGGGYLPLDPSYPRERLALLLADAAPAAVVGPRHLLAALPEIPNGAPCLAFEDAVPAADSADTLTALAGVDVPPASLAYVLYTSGSTGTPKGVEVSHRAVVRLVRDTACPSYGPGEVFLQLSPMSFDLATFELWGPLLNGGRLALLAPGPFTVDGLYAAVERHGVTTIWLTSGLFHLAVEEGLAPLGGLRQLVAGGDVLSRPHVERALAALPGVDLINGYGPTENTTFSTTHRLRDGLPAGEPSVPIGRPIAASRAYVLDPALALLPAGCVGELYVGGAGVARGYLGRPGLTAERFLPDPFSGDPLGADRLYRTGDLARWRPDGTFDFLGRRDFQVKVRGFRVELGEVENALLRHPGVREAVLTAAAETTGGHRLVAYYVPEGSDGPAPADLRLHLRESLPEHMVPSLFVPLAKLPLNASGKVDRRALPAPEARSAGEANTAPRTPPRNPVEEVIAGIWEELLGLSHPVGVDDDFFHLGGHSLLVTRLLSRLRQAFGADLPVQRVFAAPTVAGLAAAVATVTAAGHREEALPPIVPLESRDGVLPLSYPQRRLYFMDRLAPGNPTYNIPSGYLLRGPFAPAALAAALTEVVRRHEVLRTRIVIDANGEPGQEIGPPPEAPVPPPFADLSGLPPARRAPELDALAGREAGRSFDLRHDSPLRATLVRLEEDEHAFLFTLHHIASDGWSEGVLRRELSALYAAALAGDPSPIAPLPLQYADFAAWQRAWPEEALAAQLAHWKERLAGTPALELPGDRPRPPVVSFRGDALRVELPPALVEDLRRLARRGQATVFMTLLAVWHAVLQRHSGQTDFAIGTPVANRTRPELEPLIGVFLNMLALRSDGGGDPSFAELLARVRHTALAAYDHADLPFERIVDEVNAARDRSRTPLVQTMLALNSTPRVPFTLRGLAVEPLDLSPPVSRFDLSLALTEQGGELGGGLEYSTDLFDRTSMERLAGHFLRLLAAAADDPSRRVAEIDLLSPAERQQVTVELNDTAADLAGLYGGGEPLLHRWIERQAARTPDATAVVGEAESLTYRELDARANRLARRLRRMGVRVDEPVAICAERSPALVVGLLAILKAGGAYLPLDPSYPSERLAFMIEDGLDGVAKPVLLAQVELLAASVAGAGARLVDLGAAAGPAGEVEAAPLAPLDGGAGPDNLAYVIYTSGSTGRPKGVMSTHRGIVNRIAWMQRAYGLSPADRVLQKTPVSFDVSVWELFWPLVVGARLVLARPDGHRDPAYLMRRIEDQGVTTLHFVPSMLQVFLAQLAPAGLGRCRSVRQVMASGEALPADLAARFHELWGSAPVPAELHNLYGPTEASVDVTAHRTLPGPARHTVPIGRPIANLGLWLLDRELQPVPLGVPGDLYIGGVGLARGYLRRPALTAERFVPHPFGGPGERLYRTGDLARFAAGGEIEFLGRTDDQVKLRGFRIELGEIESILAGHPAVREAAVVAREERPGDVRLAAFVVPEGPGPEAGELRDALRRVLPEHMVPADFALVAALPLTPSGKLDRNALRALPLDHELASVADLDGEPDGEMDSELDALCELLTGIWQDLLRRAPIGLDDNLFDLGAHSFLVIQFTSRVYDALELEIPLRLLFEAPTVRRLGVAIQELLIEQIDSLTDEEAELQAE